MVTFADIQINPVSLVRTDTLTVADVGVQFNYLIPMSGVYMCTSAFT